MPTRPQRTALAALAPLLFVPTLFASTRRSPSLSPSAVLFTGSGPELGGDATSRAVALGDLDGDGDLDAFLLVVSLQDANLVTAGAELAATIREEREALDLPAFAGLTMEEALARVNQRRPGAVYLPLLGAGD